MLPDQAAKDSQTPLGKVTTSRLSSKDGVQLPSSFDLWKCENCGTIVGNVEAHTGQHTPPAERRQG